jgi:hypothetical protein
VEVRDRGVRQDASGGDSELKLKLKDLQHAYDIDCSFPMQLLSAPGGDDFWNSEYDVNLNIVEVLAIAEIRAKMTKRAVWRADGRVEQLCVHGVGHTISSPRRGKHEFVHGCDGCCEELR